MKLSFQPDDPYSTYREFEIVREKEELFGKPARKPQDPSIKSLLAFEEELPSFKEAEKQKWLSEARDAYRGYFYSTSDSNYYRLKVESPSPYIKNPSIEQKSEENHIEINDRVEKPIEVQKVNNPETKIEMKSIKKKEEEKEKPNTKINKPKPSQQQIKKENPRPLSSSKSVSAIQKPSEKSKNDDGRIERQEARIKKLNQTTRWLPNSAFTTYFGKPAFANYGQGNVNPVRGGYLYGDYMKSHNIAPHEGKNDPEYAQVYKNAETHGLQQKPRSPEPPRKCKDEDRLSPDQVEELKRRSQIIAEKKSTPSKKIIKPNLYEVKTFKSVHSTPNTSFEGEAEEEEDLEKNNQKNQKLKNNFVKNETANTDRCLTKTEKKSVKTLTKNHTQSKQATAVNQSSEVPEINYDENRQNLLLPAPKQPPTQQSPSFRSQESLVPQVQISNTQQPIQLKITPDQTATGNISPSPGLKSEPPSLAEPNQQFPNPNFFTTTYKEMASKIHYSPKFTSVLPLSLCEKCHEPITSELEIKPEDLCPPNSLSDMPFKELNPKNYKQLPATFTKRIPAAGKLSYKSLSAYSVIFPEY
ncbi:unnamed protein product [Blepharisma stoltei]|uniref:Uncharacterized protein n=1 Tax=Blepharisma stoltei TaxID=1481888 RepID=A0AAU9J7G1_9CILI|nr:unnamed protein product [Blepharisma stoltei]